MHQTITQVTGSNRLLENQREGQSFRLLFFYAMPLFYYLCAKEMEMDSFNTEKFLLEPAEFYDSEHLRELFPINDNEDLAEIEVPLFNAVLVYAIPKDKKEMLPSVYRMVSKIPDIPAHNKIIIEIDRENGTLYLAAIEGNSRLLLLNCYKANRASNILYYISLAAKQVMFNPPITAIYTYTPLNNDETAILERYFQKIITAQ